MTTKFSKLSVSGLFFLMLFIVTACNENAISPLQEGELTGEDLTMRTFIPNIEADEISSTCVSCIGSGRKQQCFANPVNVLHVVLDPITNNSYGSLKFSIYNTSNQLVASKISAGSPVDILLPQVGVGTTYYLKITDTASSNASPHYYFTTKDCGGDSME